MQARKKGTTEIGIFASSLALAFFYFKFGYIFGQGDQDEFVPFLMRLLDPSLFSSDWFVSQQVEHPNVRSLFVWSLFPLAKYLSVEFVFKLVYTLSFLGIGMSIFFFCNRLIKNRILSFFAPLTVLSLSHKWTLGSNDLVYTMLVPEMLAWPFAIWSIKKLLDKDYLQAGILLGIASWFQVLVGIQSAMIWTLVLLFLIIKKRNVLRDLVAFLLGFVLFSLPSVFPILEGLAQTSQIDSSELFYILAAFRNPFHHLFLSFHPGSVIKFALLLLAGMASWLLFLRTKDFEEFKLPLAFVLICIGLWVLNVTFTELVPILFIAKLQLFKLSVIVKMIGVIAVFGGVRQLFARYFTQPKLLSKDPRSFRVLNLTFAAVISAAFLFLSENADYRPVGLSEMEDWAREETNRKSLFSIPPSISSFRINAQRSIVVDYAAFPYRDQDMLEWFGRIQGVAPIGRPHRGLGIKKSLDDAFHETALKATNSNYGADYILFQKESVRPKLTEIPMYENEHWIVLKTGTSLE